MPGPLKEGPPIRRQALEPQTVSELHERAAQAVDWGAAQEKWIPAILGSLGLIGSIIHLAPADDYGKALCGRKPWRKSTGWWHQDARSPTCPECIRLNSKQPPQ